MSLCHVVVSNVKLWKITKTFQNEGFNNYILTVISMKRMIQLTAILFFVFFGGTKTFASDDQILPIKDVEMVFSLGAQEWETYAASMVAPEGWQIRRSRSSIGQPTSVAAFNPANGTGLLVAPSYLPNQEAPTHVFVSVYSSALVTNGWIELNTERFVKLAQEELGDSYIVTGNYRRDSPMTESVNFLIRRGAR